MALCSWAIASADAWHVASCRSPRNDQKRVPSNAICILPATAASRASAQRVRPRHSNPKMALSWRRTSSDNAFTWKGGLVNGFLGDDAKRAEVEEAFDIKLSTDETLWEENEFMKYVDEERE